MELVSKVSERVSVQLMMEVDVSVTLETTGESRCTRFRCPRYYFSIMSINILSVVAVEAAAQAH
jgi:hypothetical protein